MLAVFVQALSPNKYAGWGVMVLYIVVRVFGPYSGSSTSLHLRQRPRRAALGHDRRRHLLEGGLVVPALLGRHRGSCC